MLMIRLAVPLLVAALLSSCAAPCGGGGLSPCTDDQKLETAVLARINQHAALKVDLIDVQVLDRVAYIRGLVDTELERREAEAVARATPGVTEVVNKLAVNNTRQ